MYICLCNNLNSKKVNYAIEKGVSSSKKIYSFYKPKNCLCTSKDPEGRRTIYDVLDQNYKNLTMLKKE